MFTAQDVMKLRDMTGAGMMACKKAMDEANGDFDAAIDILRKRGESKAADKAGRDTGEGNVAIAIEGNKAAIVGLKCETDFVSRNEKFVELAQILAKNALHDGVDAVRADEASIKGAIATLGENIVLGEVAVVEGAVFGSYIHSNGKIGVLVVLDGGKSEIGDDIAMHAAAMSPKYLSPAEVSDETVAHEKEIWGAQLAAEGKPANIVENIMKGKEKKFREENALLTQSFVKNTDQTVEAFASANGAKVTKFVRVAI